MLDLNTQNLTRVTDDPAIDTEAVWSSDGQSLYFTSGPRRWPADLSRGREAGRTAQAHHLRRRLQRASAPEPGWHAARDGHPRWRQLPHCRSGPRVQQRAEVLSKGRQDESPSFAPNGAMLIYSDSEGGRSMLATVSTDALTGQRLKSDQGQVREPVWGPFAQ